MCYISAIGEKSYSRPSFQCQVFTHRAAKHRVAGLKRIKHATLRGNALDRQRYLSVTVGERLQVVWEHDANHEIVWVSTDNTAGKSRTMGSQLSPLSFDA